MGPTLKYLKVKKELVPDGIRRPFVFFKCLYALDAEIWKTAEKIAFEADIPINTAKGYLRIICEYGMAEKKLINRRGVHAYRLNQSHYRFKGVEW